MSLNDMHDQLARRGALWKMKKEVDAEIKALDAEIRPWLMQQTDQAVSHMGYRFECELVPGRKTLDKKAMLLAGIDYEQFEKVGAPFTKMTIKEE